MVSMSKEHTPKKITLDWANKDEKKLYPLFITTSYFPNRFLLMGKYLNPSFFGRFKKNSVLPPLQKWGGGSNLFSF